MLTTSWTVQEHFVAGHVLPIELNISRIASEGQTLTADVLSAEYRRLNEMSG